MRPDRAEPRAYEFGEFTLDVSACELRNSSQSIPLRPKSFDVLRILIENQGQLVEKSRLLNEVWKHSSVTDGSLTQCLVDIRKAIGDADRDIIRTIPRRGYIFCAPVAAVHDEQDYESTELSRRDWKYQAWGFPALAVGTLVAAFAWAVAVWMLWPEPENLAGERERPTIAVLPFNDEDVSSENVLLAESMHDDLVRNLSRTKELRVISTSSVLKLKNTGLSIADIGEKIGATAIVDTSIEQIGDELRFDIRLIDASSGKSSWTDTFLAHAFPDNIESIQIRLANSIETALQVLLPVPEPIRPRAVPMTRLAAYRAYQSGTGLLERRTGDASKAAIEYFRDAIRTDYEFARAHVGLANAYLLAANYGDLAPDQALPLALASVQTAIAIDNQLGNAYASLGSIHFEAQRHDVDLGTSQAPEHLFLRALELNPSDATAHQWYGEYLWDTIGAQAAVFEFEKALKLDPLSPIKHHMLASALKSLNRLSEAEALYLAAIDLDPGFSRAHQGLAALYASRLGRLADAAEAAYKSVLLNRSNSVNSALLASILISMGDNQRAGYWLEQGHEGQAQQPIFLATVALWHIVTGDDDTAVAILEALNRSPRASWQAFRLLKDLYIRRGQINAALELCERRDPGMFESVRSAKFDQWTAVECAQVLKLVDRLDKAEATLQALRDEISANSLRDNNRVFVLLAAIYALLDQDEAAVDALHSAIASGWRYGSLYTLRYTPSFSGLRQNDRYQQLVTDLEIEMSAERQELARTIDPIKTAGAAP